MNFFEYLGAQRVFPRREPDKFARASPATGILSTRASVFTFMIESERRSGIPFFTGQFLAFGSFL